MALLLLLLAPQALARAPGPRLPLRALPLPRHSAQQRVVALQLAMVLLPHWQDAISAASHLKEASCSVNNFFSAAPKPLAFFVHSIFARPRRSRTRKRLSSALTIRDIDESWCWPPPTRRDNRKPHRLQNRRGYGGSTSKKFESGNNPAADFQNFRLEQFVD